MWAQLQHAQTKPRAIRGSWSSWLALLVLGLLAGPTMAQSDGFAAHSQRDRRCVVLELYHEGEDDAYQAVEAAIAKLESRRSGLIVVHRNVQEEKNRQRQLAIAKYYRIDDTELPFAYGGNRVTVWKADDERFLGSCEKMLEMEVFVRPGCHHCARARTYLADFAARYPAIRIVYRDLVTERGAVSDLNALVRKHRKAAASVPVFCACDQMLIGFDRGETSGRRLEKIFERWTIPWPAENKSDADDSGPKSNDTLNQASDGRWTGWLVSGVSGNSLTTSLLGLIQSDNATPDLPFPDLPLPESNGPTLPLPDEADDHSIQLPDQPGDERRRVEIPWFGEVDLYQVGLPAFTLAIGLVDGFNPCAMWVLLFLLSILVNLRHRARILAVAGSFVVVSGLVYFVFMAAWLNVFLLIGLLRPVQVLLGLVGLMVGAIHVKDFFAFKKGVSLSIPEAAKPGIYARTRAIITAEHLAGAILGAVTLAVLVNIVELLCTAGLPALYTEVLASYQLPIWKNYAYLGIYILAYMFDDSLMVAAVVLTLSKRRLQESQGRWLKLISGVVIMALGLVVLLQPEWLM